MTTVPGRKAGPFVCRFCPGIAGDCASDAVSLQIAPDVFHVLHIGVPEFADAPPLFGENDPVPGKLENQRCGKQDGGLRQKRRADDASGRHGGFPLAKRVRRLYNIEQQNCKGRRGKSRMAAFSVVRRDTVEHMERKKKIALDPRLQKCADFVRCGVRVADIGTDHGYLPIALLQSGKAVSAVAADINAAPLESAVRNAARFGVSDRMRCVLSDGLAALSPQDADDVVVAGMGGELILRIISEADWLRAPEKHLVLQPMTTADRLRAGLYAAGFAIDREDAVFDGKKIYSVLSVFFTGEAKTALPLRMLHMGCIRPGSPDSARYAASVLHHLENQRAGLRHAGGDAAALEAAIDEIRAAYRPEAE